MKIGSLVLGLIIGLGICARSQSVSFSLLPNKSNFCLNENIGFVNQSSGIDTYDWDFCSGDLDSLPVNTHLNSLGVGDMRSIQTVQDNGLWYSFAIAKTANKLLRYNYGNSLANAPNVVDLGNPGGLLNNASSFKLLKEGNSWYGLVNNGGNGKLIRWTFSSGLNQPPAAVEVLSGIGVEFSGMDLERDGDSLVAVVSNYNPGNNFVLVNFGTSITNNPNVSDVKASAPFKEPNLTPIDFVDADIVKYGNQWYGFCLSWDDKTLYRLDFANGNKDLFSVPTITPLYNFATRQSRVQYVREGGEFFLFIASESGSILRIKLNGSITGSVSQADDLGNFGALNNNWGLSMAEESGNWYALVLGLSGTLDRLSFPNHCGAIPGVSSASEPSVQYALPGTFKITLTGRGAAEFEDQLTKTITVSAVPAPIIDFTIDPSRCVGNVNNFAAVTAGNIVTYAWDFGDGNTAVIPAPSNQYNVAGQYAVALSVTANNACSNRIVKSLQIFNPPSANFTLPNPAITCTNQSYTFVNTSTSDPLSNPAWQWNVNNTPVSVSQDLTYSFSTTVGQQIQLVASIPGCSTQSTQILNVQLPGPLVDFSTGNGCAGQALDFNNTSSGSISGYLWDFGDGTTSTNASPSNAYATAGTYSVTLSASSSNGCNNQTSKLINVYSTPQPAFLLDLPPFSCSGTVSQFHDATPNPTDSNLSAWAWAFGDAANGTSNQRDATYTYAIAGPYTVGLTVTTNFGCSGVVQQVINIAQSPGASFSNSTACVNQGTQFTDTSTGSIKSWQWKIDNSSYSFFNPIHVFGNSGSYTAQLIVTDNNKCIGVVTRPISVPVYQSADFTSSSTCATKPSVFQNVTPVSMDPILAVTWDFGGMGSGNGSPAQFIFPDAGNYPVTMDAHATSGCVYSVTKTIVEAEPPVAGFTPSAEAGAAPLLVQFENTSSNASNYNWHFHDKTDSTSTVVSPSYSFNELGDYVVDLDAFTAEGCMDTHSTMISVVVPSVDAALNDLQFVTDPISGERQTLFIVENKGNLPLTNPTILVEISGGITLKENLNLTVKPGQSASQVLRYSLLPGDVHYVCLEVETTGDVDLYNNKQCASLFGETIAFGPYPNPANGELHLDWITTTEGTAEISIFASTGAKAFDTTVSAPGAGLNQIRVDVSNLSSGIYLIVCNYAGLKKTFRFAVQ